MEEMPLKTLEELEAECLRAKVGKRCLDAQSAQITIRRFFGLGIRRLRCERFIIPSREDRPWQA